MRRFVQMTSASFHPIEDLHRGRDWGAFLDAGAGVGSALWPLVLKTKR